MICLQLKDFGNNVLSVPIRTSWLTGCRVSVSCCSPIRFENYCRSGQNKDMEKPK